MYLIKFWPLKISNIIYHSGIIIVSNAFVFSQSTINMDGFGQLPQINGNAVSQNTYKDNIESRYNISFNINTISNSGHPNLDNYAELYVKGSSARLISARFEYSTSWLSLELEPYTISQNGIFKKGPHSGTYQATNNHNNANNYLGQTKMGFRQSRLVLHYKGFGIGYGNMSHWWSPGFHSALALSSNAPSQETYALGTFQDISLGRFSFGGQIIAMPYTNKDNVQLYFSGLKAHITYHSNPVITLGLHRTYLSGNFSHLSATTNISGAWTLEDATRLVIEPLFGQSKSNLAYAIIGTPGFDYWDEVLTGYVKLTFPDEQLEVYADVASDDNRGNLTDLKAHWDHTLGYMLGFMKFTRLEQWSLFTGAEYLTTRVSNTFKSEFFRFEPNAINFYTKQRYDYFTYQGRRMGAHSGSSSDDLIFMLGFGNEKSMAFVSYNKERHGIKNMTHPELKTEYSLTYHRKITQHHTAFITLEYEKIKNFNFVQKNISVSKLIWLGYSFSIN